VTPTVPHILLTAHGNLPGGDNWTCGLRTYKRDSFLSPASGNSLAVAAANRWMAFRNTVSGLGLFGGVVSKRATIEGVTVREIDGDGIGVTQYEGIPTTAYTASVLDQTMPNQCSLVVTLCTDRAGRTGKGRIFLPCLAIQTGYLVGGQLGAVAAGYTDLLGDGLKVMLDGINTDLTTHFGSVLPLAVQSPTAAKAWFDDNSLADYNGAKITSIKIGSVIDTLRRRRSSVKESYITKVIA
jgi:hypothetical protein